MKRQAFHFALGEPGTAIAQYTVDGIESDFELTNVCNPLGDMLAAMAQLLTSPSQLWDGSNTAAFVWYAEEESYNWELTVDHDEMLAVRVSQTCDFFGDDPVELVEARCSVTDFVECIVKELDRFIKHVGLLNYQQQWQTAEFPLTYFLILKRHLMERGQWKGDNGIDSLNLETEVSMLMG